MKYLVLSTGLLAGVLMLFFRLGKYQVLQNDLSQEWWVIIVAVVAFVSGIMFRWYSTKEKSIRTVLWQTSNLSKREYEVLQALAAGMTNKEIADHLFISETTVKSHVSSLLNKLKASNRTAAVQKARQKQLIAS